MTATVQAPVREVSKVKTTTKRTRRNRVIDRILADATKNAARYVKDYNVGRGGE